MIQINEEYTHIKGTPKKLVVFLHGYEQTARLINKLIPPFLESIDDCVLIIPSSSHCCEVDTQKCQWYSIKDFDPKDIRRTSKDFSKVVKIYEKSQPSIEPAFLGLKKYIRQKLKEYNIKTKDLYICGFSQGASLGLYTGLMFPHKIAGIVSISGMLSPAKYLLKNHKINTNTLLIHGKEDDFISFEALEFSKTNLEKIGCTVETYAMDNTNHFITQEALISAATFINTKK